MARKPPVLTHIGSTSSKSAISQAVPTSRVSTFKILLKPLSGTGLPDLVWCTSFGTETALTVKSRQIASKQTWLFQFYASVLTPPGVSCGLTNTFWRWTNPQAYQDGPSSEKLNSGKCYQRMHNQSTDDGTWSGWDNCHAAVHCREFRASFAGFTDKLRDIDPSL